MTQALSLSPRRDKPSTPSRVSLPPGLLGLSAQLPLSSLERISLHPVLDTVCSGFPLNEFGPGEPVASALKWEDFSPPAWRSSLDCARKQEDTRINKVATFLWGLRRSDHSAAPQFPFLHGEEMGEFDF